MPHRCTGAAINTEVEVIYRALPCRGPTLDRSRDDSSTSTPPSSVRPNIRHARSALLSIPISQWVKTCSRAIG